MTAKAHSWRIGLAITLGFCLLVVSHSLESVAFADDTEQWQHKIDDRVYELSADGAYEFLIYMEEQADLSSATRLTEKNLKGRYVVDTLQELARQTQAPIVAILDAAGIQHQTFWLANLILVLGDQHILETLARRY